MIWRPGIAFYNRFRFQGKLLWLSVPMLLALLALGSLQVQHRWQDAQNLLREQEGVQAADRALHLVRAVQDYRSAVASGATNQAQQWATVLQSAQVILDHPLHYSSGSDRQMRSMLEALGTINQGTLDQRIEQQSLLIILAMQSIQQIQVDAGLDIDPDDQRFYLQNIALSMLPEINETVESAYVSLSHQGVGSLLEVQHNLLRLDGMDVHLQAYWRRASATGEAVYTQKAQDMSDLIEQHRQLRAVINQPNIDVQSLKRVLDGVLLDSVQHGRAVSDSLRKALLIKMQEGVQEAYQRIVFWVIGFVVLLAYSLYSIGALTAAIEEAMRRSSIILQQLSKGDLRVRLHLDSQDELQQMALSINALADAFQSVIRDMASVSQRLASSAEELSVSTEQTSSGARTQSEQAVAVIDAVRQMTEALQNVASNAEATARETQQSKDLMDQGQGRVSETVNEINQLANGMRATEEIFEQLGKDADAMGTIVAVIRGVADQTNLLALNAAIEAARAGEQGRGFAVVADEVRTLAGRTQESTQEIDLLIRRLQDGAERAVEAMNKMRGNSEDSAGRAVEAGHALESTRASIDTVVYKNVEVASAVEEMSQAARAINGNIETIGDVTRQNVLVFEETAQATAELSGLADSLSSTVNRFDV